MLHLDALAAVSQNFNLQQYNPEELNKEAAEATQEKNHPSFTCTCDR